MTVKLSQGQQRQVKCNLADCLGGWGGGCRTKTNSNKITIVRWCGSHQRLWQGADWRISVSI